MTAARDPAIQSQRKNLVYLGNPRNNAARRDGKMDPVNNTIRLIITPRMDGARLEGRGGVKTSETVVLPIDEGAFAYPSLLAYFYDKPIIFARLYQETR